MLTSFLLSQFRRYAKRYLSAHPEVKLIVVTGTIGKTSAKRAIGTVLSRSFRVRMHEYPVENPLDFYLAILGIELPEAKPTIGDWLRALRAARYQIAHPPVIDVIVQELNLDHPGAAKGYASLHPSIAVMTAITVDDIAKFQSVDAMATEEFSITDRAGYVLINRDDIPIAYAGLEHNPNFSTYGSAGAAEYRVEPIDLDKVHQIPAQVIAPELEGVANIEINIVGEHLVRPLAAAVAVGFKLGMQRDEILKGIESVTPLPGRLQPLQGLDETIVLDDSWSIDPNSLIADLQTLYQFEDSSKRIAVVGSIPVPSEQAEVIYKSIGEACNGSILSWLVLVGEANEHLLAPIARQHGCQVKICRDAVDAAEFVRSVSEAGSTILVKGGADDVLEETVKLLVESTEHPKLVRQDAVWRAKKATLFSRFDFS